MNNENVTQQMVTDNPAREKEIKDKAVYWLLRAHRARRRQGWEGGETEEETWGHIFDFLANLSFDPCDEENEKWVTYYLTTIEERYQKKMC